MFNGTPNQTYVSHRLEKLPNADICMPCIYWNSPHFEYRSYRNDEGDISTFRVGPKSTDARLIGFALNPPEVRWLSNLFQEHFGSPTREYNDEDQTDPWEPNEPAPRFVLDEWQLREYNAEMVPSIDWYRGDRQYRTFLLPDGKLSTHKRWDEDGGGISNWTVDNELLAEDVACLHGYFTKLFGKPASPVPEPPPAPELPKLKCQVYIFDQWVNVDEVESLPQLRKLYSAIYQTVGGDKVANIVMRTSALTSFKQYLSTLPHRWV